MAETVAPAPAGVAATGQPKVPGARNDVETRIAELSAQKAHFQKKAGVFESELRGMREELSFLKGKMETPAPPAAAQSPRTLADMNDQQLEDAKRWARQNSSDETLDGVYQEQARREAKRAADSAVERSNKNYQHAEHLRDVRARILSDFGDDAINPDSPLYAAADRQMANYINRYGKEAVRGDPDKLYDAFLRAERETKTSAERERLKTLEGESAELKRRVTLFERGGVPGMAPRPPDAVSEALKRGDRRGAIKESAIFKGLSAQIKRDASLTR